MDNKFFWLIAVVVVFLSWVAKSTGQRTKAQEAHRDRCNGDAILLDVRTEGEFSEGHIKGAVNIPVQILESRVANLKDQLKQTNSKKVWIYCRSGARASTALAILKRSGFDAASFGSMSAWPAHQKCSE